MSVAEISRARDRLDRHGSGKPEIDLEPLLGTWVIFADETEGLSRIEITEADGAVRARVYGSAPAEAPDWGPTDATVFSDDVDGKAAWGLRATYDHGFERVELFGYLNRGLLALEAGTTFADGSGRSPYFTRTFLYRP